MRSQFAILLPLLCVCASCTFAGLGNYPIETCSAPTGKTTTIQGLGNLDANADLTFASASGVDTTGAYVTVAPSGGTCVQGVGTAGYLSTSCAFFGGMTGLSLRQPWAIPIGGGHAAAAIATTAPCNQGQVWVEYNAPSGTLDTPEGTLSTPGGTCDPTGASLPSLAPLGSTSALVAWYQTPLATRDDPLESCDSALGAPLVAAVATFTANSATASLAAPVTLSAESISVRPAATLTVGSQVVVAAPNGDSVGIWALDGTTTTAPSPVSITGLAGARAVSIAADGAGHLAVVAEIGCTPQSIVLATGTLAGGFVQTTTVAPKGQDGALQPTVAWVPTESAWIVSWISLSGGPHALARRFDVNGAPHGGVIDPGTAALNAAVTSDGDLLAYVVGSLTFVSASLGCPE